MCDCVDVYVCVCVCLSLAGLYRLFFRASLDVAVRLHVFELCNRCQDHHHKYGGSTVVMVTLRFAEYFGMLGESHTGPSQERSCDTSGCGVDLAW